MLRRSALAAAPTSCALWGRHSVTESFWEAAHREFVYLWYYFTVQLDQIFWYWVIGILAGSAVAVFAKEWVHRAVGSLGSSGAGALAVFPASLLGIASPLCMYGTIPLAASLSKAGVRDDFLAAFMMSSVLLNPQLIAYSAALGPEAVAIRISSCFACGVAAGLLVRRCAAPNRFFRFDGFREPENRDTAQNVAVRYSANVWRNIRATGPWFLAGIALSALFQRYVPADAFASMFGTRGEAFGVLMAATVGVPLYACGGGTIPLLQSWLESGMSMGSAAAFMLTGPSTKITNMSALKIVLGGRSFALYIGFVLAFSLAIGVLVNAVV